MIGWHISDKYFLCGEKFGIICRATLPLSTNLKKGAPHESRCKYAITFGFVTVLFLVPSLLYNIPNQKINRDLPPLPSSQG